ncbi:hypothetical protein SAMN05421858_5071 [Haladaptatus litoreus]|uniref:Uncharacterized protein n=1 Tax=Haladaptatus litoreus TaxID=553468 RepID=A0A1N7FHM1_9EURY|nr:hypothetical protein SAMN05421858_5071 [Haladaptatus litoreus]
MLEPRTTMEWNWLVLKALLVLYCIYAVTAVIAVST